MLILPSICSRLPFRIRPCGWLTQDHIAQSILLPVIYLVPLSKQPLNGTEVLESASATEWGSTGRLSIYIYSVDSRENICLLRIFLQCILKYLRIWPEKWRKTQIISGHQCLMNNMLNRCWPWVIVFPFKNPIPHWTIFCTKLYLVTTSTLSKPISQKTWSKSVHWLNSNPHPCRAWCELQFGLARVLCHYGGPDPRKMISASQSIFWNMGLVWTNLELHTGFQHWYWLS